MRIIFGTALILCAASALVLFGPPAWVEYLSLELYRTTYRPTLGLTLLISGITAGITALALILGSMHHSWQKHRRRRAYHLSLLQMTSDEQRRYLRDFMASQQPILYPRLDRVAKSLRKAGILVIDSKQGSLCVAAHQLKPWARTLLKRHEDLLEVSSPVEPPADVAPAHRFGSRPEKFTNPIVA
jgi:hypothetical protein